MEVQHGIHMAHRQNPAIAPLLKSLCILDGNSPKEEDLAHGIVKLPGQVPESEVFDYVKGDLQNLSMKLTVGLHLSPEKEAWVRSEVEKISLTNRDAHLLFNQVGQRTGLIPTNIVSSAFISLWQDGNKGKAKRISEFIKSALTTPNDKAAA
jgi:hypothetical protein